MELCKLAHTLKRYLEIDTDIAEIEETICHMKLGKSPGMNGLTLEFYRTFRGDISPYLLELFKYCQQQSDSRI